MMIDHDTDAPGIAIVRSSRSWARTLHRYVVDHGGAIVRARPLEERQALEETYDILIVDDISSFLSSHIVDELHRRDRRVLGVFDPEEFASDGESTGRARLLRLGVDGVIEAQATPEEFVRVIEDLAPERHIDITNDLTLLDEHEDENIPGGGIGVIDVTDLASSFEPGGSSEIVLAPRTTMARRRGHITTVFGATGGCGVTEIATELARSLGKRGERTVLLDSDEMSPSLAQRLNLALHPNVRTAVDVIEHSTGRLSECLTAIAPNLEILVGLPHPKDWIELRATDTIALIEELSHGRPQVVVNASPCIEDLTSIGSADRFAMSRAAVETSDTIVLVCPPTPVGVARLIDRTADLTELAAGKPVHIVINRVQKGSFKRNEIAREIERCFSPAGIHFVPADLRVESAAWEGTLVPSGEFTKAVASELTVTIPHANFATRKRTAAGSGNSGSAANFGASDSGTSASGRNRSTRTRG